MNVFLKNKKQKKPPIQSLTDCTVTQCFLEDLHTLMRVSKITVCHGNECLVLQRRKVLRCNQRSINVILHSTQIFKGF